MELLIFLAASVLVSSLLMSRQEGRAGHSAGPRWGLIIFILVFIALVSGRFSEIAGVLLGPAATLFILYICFKSFFRGISR